VGGEQPLVVLDALTAPGALDQLRQQLADPGSRDLAQLLKYDGAVDDHGNVVVPAREILVTPFWRAAFCRTVIRAAEISGRWESPDDGPTPRSEIALHTLSPRLLALAEQDLRVRVWPRLAVHWPQLTEVSLQEAVVLRCEAGEANLASPPSAVGAQIKGLVRLNDGYAGGSNLFPRQAWDDRRVSTGSLIVWPAAFTHPHRAQSVSRGVRYGLRLSWHAGPI
jgi:hypothetical protein